MNKTSLVKTATSLFADGNYAQALQLFNEAKVRYPEISGAFDASINLCERRLSSRAGVALNGDPEIDITLTTIKSRVDLLEKVIVSLHQQQLPPKNIYINVSREAYLLDEGIDPSDCSLKRLEQYPLVQICWTENTGPYRKILPYLERHFHSEPGLPRLFVTVDDDTIYPADFLRILYEQYLWHDCIVAFRGRKIQLSGQRLATYEQWGPGESAPKFVNLPTGKDGILYSTSFFTQEILDIELAKRLVPTADDLWIKWHCALNGVKSLIIKHDAVKSWKNGFSGVSDTHSYRDASLFAAYNRAESGGKNDIGVAGLEAHYMKVYGYSICDLILNFDLHG